MRPNYIIATLFIASVTNAAPPPSQLYKQLEARYLQLQNTSKVIRKKIDYCSHWLPPGDEASKASISRLELLEQAVANTMDKIEQCYNSTRWIAKSLSDLAKNRPPPEIAGDRLHLYGASEQKVREICYESPADTAYYLTKLETWLTTMQSICRTR